MVYLELKYFTFNCPCSKLAMTSAFIDTCDVLSRGFDSPARAFYPYHVFMQNEWISTIVHFVFRYALYLSFHLILKHRNYSLWVSMKVAHFTSNCPRRQVGSSTEPVDTSRPKLWVRFHCAGFLIEPCVFARNEVSAKSNLIFYRFAKFPPIQFLTLQLDFTTFIDCLRKYFPKSWVRIPQVTLFSVYLRMLEKWRNAQQR